MPGFVLYVETKQQKHTLKTLGPSSSVGMLKQELSNLAGIPISDLYVLCGFPLVHLELADDQMTLESNNICSGDRLVVQEKIKSFQEKNAHEDYFPQGQQKPGFLMRKSVPADNSCLFTSVRFALTGDLDPNCALSMRQIIVEVVENDSETYSEAILGRPNIEYCEWILRPTSWGGGIELAILSKFYGVEIVVLDSVNGILNRFGEDQDYSYRIFLFFDGVHYDPLYLEDFQSSSKKPKTLFPITDENVLSTAEILVREAKASRQSLDVNKFTIRCIECDILLSGQSAAGAHAKKTGHTCFSEVDYD